MNIIDYVNLSEKDKYEFVTERVRSDAFSINIIDGHLQIRHKETDLNFVFVPGGAYNKGLTDPEYSLVRKINDHEFEDVDLEYLRPAHKCSVNDFLVTEYPVSWETLSRFYPQYRENRGAAWLDKKTLDKVCSEFKLRLISDDEWEYMARCGKQQLFPFGNSLLSKEMELEKWLILDRDKSRMYCNDLGVYGLFYGEWTGSHYTDSYSPSDMNNEQETFSIRGGASIFWPWQDCGEWLRCICAYRMSSDGLFDDKAAAFRLVYGL